MGRNEIEIQVTAEDGQTKQSYFLYITKGDSSQANANLKEIKVKNAELAPYFDKNTINYALEYPESLEKLEIEAVPEDSNAKVEIIGNENLVETTQNIEIKVTAKDGQTIKTYYLIAKKAGIPVEEPEGKEPESEEIQENEIENNNNITNELQDKDINDSKDFNIGWYFIIALVVIVIIVIIVKIILEKRRRKNEK